MNKKILMTVGLIGILIPFNTKALTGSMNLSCNSNTLTVNTSTTCTLSGNSNEEISALSAKLNASGNISISNISTSSIWQGNGEGGSIDLYTDTNKSGNFAVATFTIQANSTAGTGAINVNGINFSDASFNEHSISGNSLTITVKEVEKPKEENNTQNNQPSNNDKPNADTKPNTNTTQKPTVQQNNQPTQNVETKSNDATLKSLVLSNGVINFSSDVLDYNVEVSNDVESIAISAEATDIKSQVSIPENLNLKLGINDFEIKVVAEDGTEKFYKLHINRLEKVLSKNSNLKTLEIDGYKLSFTTDKYIYDLKDINKSSLNIKAIAEDENATVEIYGNDSIGKNDSIVIKVVAEDGTTSEYIIYANNIENSSSNVSFIVVLLLFIISLGLNIFFIVKLNKNKKSKIDNKQNDNIVYNQMN